MVPQSSESWVWWSINLCICLLCSWWLWFHREQTHHRSKMPCCLTMKSCCSPRWNELADINETCRRKGYDHGLVSGRSCRKPWNLLSKIWKNLQIFLETILGLECLCIFLGYTVYPIILDKMIPMKRHILGTDGMVTEDFSKCFCWLDLNWIWQTKPIAPNQHLKIQNLMMAGYRRSVHLLMVRVSVYIIIELWFGNLRHFGHVPRATAVVSSLEIPDLTVPLLKVIYNLLGTIYHLSSVQNLCRLIIIVDSYAT